MHSARSARWCLVIFRKNIRFFCKIFVLFCKNIQLRNKISLHPIFNFKGYYLIWSTIWSTCLVNILPNHFYYCHITYFGREIIPKAHSANFVCKVNDFFWNYAYFARFSCRMCLIFNIYRRIGISSCHNLSQLKEKRMDSCGVSLGLSLDVLIYN